MSDNEIIKKGRDLQDKLDTLFENQEVLRKAFVNVFRELIYKETKVVHLIIPTFHGHSAPDVGYFMDKLLEFFSIMNIEVERFKDRTIRYKDSQVKIVTRSEYYSDRYDELCRGIRDIAMVSV